VLSEQPLYIAVLIFDGRYYRVNPNLSRRKTTVKAFFLKTLMFGTRVIGIWFMRSMAWVIAGGYFVFHKKRVKASTELYKAIFPGRSSFFYRRCVWKQFQDFSSSYSDRINYQRGGSVDFEEEGWDHFVKASKEGTGGVVLMSHVGNWEIAARHHRRKGLKILAVMGERTPKQVARFQREDMKADGLEVLVSSKETGSPFDGLEALEFLDEGGFVGIAGDFSWAKGPKSEKALLFGHEVYVPVAPHMIALLSGAPIFTFFAFRKGRNKYSVIISKPRWVKAGSRAERKAAIRQSVQAYAGELEKAIRNCPWQWHVFEPILGPPAGEG
jgi:lauroyl/myristoyl acyltransferase